MVNWKRQGIVFAIAMAFASWHMYRSVSTGAGATTGFTGAKNLALHYINQREHEVVEGRTGPGNSKIIVLKRTFGEDSVAPVVVAEIEEILMSPARRQKLMEINRKRAEGRKKRARPSRGKRGRKVKGKGRGGSHAPSLPAIPVVKCHVYHESMQPLQDALVAAGYAMEPRRPKEQAKAEKEEQVKGQEEQQQQQPVKEEVKEPTEADKAKKEAEAEPAIIKPAPEFSGSEFAVHAPVRALEKAAKAEGGEPRADADPKADRDEELREAARAALKEAAAKVASGGDDAPAEVGSDVAEAKVAADGEAEVKAEEPPAAAAATSNEAGSEGEL